MDIQIFYFVASSFWLVAAWFAASWLSADEALLAGGEGTARSQSRFGGSLLLRIFAPAILSLAQLMAILPMPKQREKLQKKLLQAGQPGGLSVDEFNATRVIAAIVACFAGMFIDSEVDLSPVCTLGLTALGLVYPDIWLSGKIQKRRRRMFRDLPDTLDMLRLAVDAGLDLNSALKVVVEKGRRGPLLDEFDRIERDITLGRTRKEAFRSFADRAQMSEISSFVLALIQADQLGASIGPVLKVQAEVARARRWQLAEVIVNKMPIKLLGPLVTLIFPASFIILFTPLVIQYFESTE